MGIPPHFCGTHVCEEEPAELKHLSRQRKRNQIEIGLVKAIEHPTGQTESLYEEYREMWSLDLFTP